MTLAKLTDREREVVGLISEEGLANKAVAFRLGIQETTVKMHVKAAMKQMGARNRVQLVIHYWKEKIEGATK